MHTKPFLATFGVAVLLLVGAGCSSDGSDAGDEPAPTSAPDDAGDGGSEPTPTEATDGGSDDGSADDVALPEGWPADVELPADTTLVESFAASETALGVVARIDGDVEAAFDDLVASLTGAGYEIVGEQFTATQEGGFGSISARGDEHTVAIAFGPDATGDTHQIAVNVAAVAP